MRRLRFGIVAVMIGALALLIAGCGGPDPDAANTPAGTPTITNGQTETTPAGGGEGGAEGDAEAGKTIFAGTCQGCHLNGGTEAGAGPIIAGGTLTADAIKKQIESPVGSMPANLVSGADLANVVAFVASLQKASQGGGGETGGGGGDDAAVAAGKEYFTTACNACHNNGGTVAGVGPKLAGAGLTAEAIKTQIETPRGSMPAGLASGADLENVVKFVLSLQ